MSELRTSRPDTTDSSRRLLLVARVVLWTAVGILLLTLSFLCFFGSVEENLPQRTVRGRTAPFHATLATHLPSRLEGLEIEVLEDGEPLADLEDLPRWTVQESGIGSPTVLKVYFAASDGSNPRSNDRQYSIRYPRRRLAASFALVLICCTLVPLMAAQADRSLRSGSSRRSSPSSTAAWCVPVTALLYSLFALQAWLPPPNTEWFLLVASCGLAPLLHRLDSGRVLLGAWIPWLGGFALWALWSSVVSVPYGSSDQAILFSAMTVWGLILYFGLQHRVTGADAVQAKHFLVLTFVATVGLSLARDAGFDLAGGLTFLGLSSSWSDGMRNPWTTKFLAHWLLVLGWCTWMALGRGRNARWATIGLSVLGLCALIFNQSPSALLALVLSVAMGAMALRRPRRTRRLVVGGLVACVLLAPLLAGASWLTYTALRDSPAAPILAGLNLNVRGGIWEFSRQLIHEHPVVGWGFGASDGLPGRDIPMDEALDLEEGLPLPPPTEHAVFAGGHPHNVALLTWLDLGLLGALLVAGFLVAVGRSIAATESDRRTHGALVGLLTVQAVYLALNYPAWEPEVMSILWMGAALASATLPRIETSSKKLVRDGSMILLLLGLGGGVLAQQRLSGWLAMRDFQENEIVLDASVGRLFVGDEEERRLEPGTSWKAHAEIVEPNVVRGWIYDPATGEAPETVLIFVGSHLAAIVAPDRPSPELFLATRPKDVSALTAGFSAPVDLEPLDLEAPIALVALGSTAGTMIVLPSVTIHETQ